MTHLTMDQLLELRDGLTEPGGAAARVHLAQCPQCQAELERLHQRVAQLKALPTLTPPRDGWPVVRSRLVKARHRRFAWGGAGGLALAASIALVLLLRPALPTPPSSSPNAQAELEAAMLESRLLEQALTQYAPERRVTDGYTARVAAELEDRISALDQQLQMTQMTPAPEGDRALLELWRQRVGLMDALVNVHLTRASNVGL
ncbi:MAG: hypothetical protein E4H37_00715 [Gemmatimonadales bacterium]|nr:MAG: hypothetical protein E4H37_00715 [Gemmatimonadales bacterium]